MSYHQPCRNLVCPHICWAKTCLAVRSLDNYSTEKSGELFSLANIVRMEPWYLLSHWGFLYFTLARRLGDPHRKCNLGELQMLTTCGLREWKLSATKCQLMLGSVAESQGALARCETSVDAALSRTTEEPGSTGTHGTNEKRKTWTV